MLGKKEEKWRKELGQNVENFEETFKDIHYVTNIPKYRSFQYRILHRALVTNEDLYKWGNRETSACELCGKEQETYSHLFVLCEKVQDFWIRTEEMMGKYGEENINFNVENVLFNKLVEKPGDVKNFICLLAKQYIYKQRCLKKEINCFEFKGQVRKIKAMELYNAQKKGRTKRHFKKWGEKTREQNDVYIREYLLNSM